jgi:hypothetical protein
MDACLLHALALDKQSLSLFVGSRFFGEEP